jgi:large subunit ribosomal protein L4
MSAAAVYDQTGARVGEVELAAAVFGVTPHTAVLHEALLWQLAGRRRGTHATLTRGFVDRTTRKLYRQKGTGRARHGSRNAPLFVGGGVAFGPQPRDHSYRLPRKVRRLALRSVLASLLQAIGAEGPVLVVTGAPHPALDRAAANLKRVRVRPAAGLTVHDILASDRMLIARDALAHLTEALAS